jgi:hypothetical protein
MADLWVIVTVIGFFTLCVGFVWGCDRIIGPDDESDLATYAPESEPDLAEVTR